MRLTDLAARLADRWPAGDPRPPRAPAVLLDAVMAGQPLRSLEWLHLIRHKPELDDRFPDRAAPAAERIWAAAVTDPVLRRMLLARLIAGLCGGAGLCDSLLVAFRQHAPLARVDPLQQAVLAALLVLPEDPGVFIDVLITHERTPAAMLRRLELPDTLRVLPALHAALPAALCRNPDAERWLLSCLSELTPTQRDDLAGVVLTGLSREALAEREELSWWLMRSYSQSRPGSRWRYLSEAALARLPA